MLRVLIVCTGNICRSPIAEGLLAQRSRQRLGGALRVRSAGTWARPGQPPTPEAIAAVAERGVDIAGLSSTHFSADLARGADLVVTMTHEQRGEVEDVAPEAASKTFTLKELVGLLGMLPGAAGTLSREALLERVEAAQRLRAQGAGPQIGDEDILDPLGMEPSAYHSVAWEIEELLDALVKGLAGAVQPVSAPGSDRKD